MVPFRSPLPAERPKQTYTLGCGARWRACRGNILKVLCVILHQLILLPGSAELRCSQSLWGLSEASVRLPPSPAGGSVEYYSRPSGLAAFLWSMPLPTSQTDQTFRTRSELRHRSSSCLCLVDDIPVFIFIWNVRIHQLYRPKALWEAWTWSFDISVRINIKHCNIAELLWFISCPKCLLCTNIYFRRIKNSLLFSSVMLCWAKVSLGKCLDSTA